MQKESLLLQDRSEVAEELPFPIHLLLLVLVRYGHKYGVEREASPLPFCQSLHLHPNPERRRQGLFETRALGSKLDL